MYVCPYTCICVYMFGNNCNVGYKKKGMRIWMYLFTTLYWICILHDHKLCHVHLEFDEHTISLLIPYYSRCVFVLFFISFDLVGFHSIDSLYWWWCYVSFTKPVWILLLFFFASSSLHLKSVVTQMFFFLSSSHSHRFISSVAFSYTVHRVHGIAYI